MQTRALMAAVFVVACRGGEPSPTAPSPVAAKVAALDAAPADTPADSSTPDAPVQRTTSSPPEARCPSPSPAVDADLKRKITQDRTVSAAIKAPPQITAICEQQAGWLVSVVFPADMKYPIGDEKTRAADGTMSTVWLVKHRGDPQLLYGWVAGPTYDFDGDGTPEASTMFGAELKIWFAGGQKPSYTVVGFPDRQHPASYWAALDHQVVWLARDDRGALHAYAFRPGEAHRELPRAACLQAAGPSANCADQPAESPPKPAEDKRSAQIAQILAKRASSASCVQPDAAFRAQQEAILEQAVLRALDDRELRGAAVPLDIAWGCTSHGETPVVVSVYEQNDATGSELWTIRADKATRRGSHWSPPPDEWSAGRRYAIGNHGDFDGDGFDESILEEQYSHGGYVQYTVNLGGRDRVVPSKLVLRAADGKRDAIARLRPFAVGAPVPAPCVQTTPDSCLPGPPPAGWLPDQADGSWDWEREPPQILVWRGAKFEPLASTAAAAIISETTAERAALR